MPSIHGGQDSGVPSGKQEIPDSGTAVYPYGGEGRDPCEGYEPDFGDETEDFKSASSVSGPHGGEFSGKWMGDRSGPEPDPDFK